MSAADNNDIQGSWAITVARDRAAVFRAPQEAEWTISIPRDGVEPRISVAH